MKLIAFFLIFFLSQCTPKKEEIILPVDLSSQKKEELKSFLSTENKYNKDVAFLVDFSEPSNRKRLLVYDIQKDSVLIRGLVAHGSCDRGLQPKGENYANIENSHCSSLGKYSVGNSYQGKFGLAYKLHGLESSNNKAFARFIVLHAHSCVPDLEPNYLICESWGCPTVSPLFLRDLADFIDDSKKPILLWLYDDSAEQTQ